MRTTAVPWLLALAVLAGCSPSTTPDPQRATARADKRSLFADASVLPTRTGERMRRELALAGEIVAALELLELAPAHAHVDLSSELARVSVVATDPAAGDDPTLESQVRLLAASIVGTEAEQVTLWLRPPTGEPAPDPGSPSRQTLAAMLLFAVGLCGGVALERQLARRRRQLA